MEIAGIKDFSARFKELFSNPIRLAAALLGAIVGGYIFFDASTLSGFIAGIVGTAIFSLLTAFLLQSLYSREWKESVLVFVLLVAILGGFTLSQSSITCLRGVYALDYNTLTDTCQVNGYTCNVDRPWYKTKCTGENLREYCERTSFSPDRRIPNPTSRAGYTACREAGYVE